MELLTRGSIDGNCSCCQVTGRVEGRSGHYFPKWSSSHTLITIDPHANCTSTGAVGRKIANWHSKAVVMGHLQHWALPTLCSTTVSRVCSCSEAVSHGSRPLSSSSRQTPARYEQIVDTCSDISAARWATNLARLRLRCIRSHGHGGNPSWSINPWYSHIPATYTILVESVSDAHGKVTVQ